MNEINQLLASLESLEFWINTHNNNAVCMTLQNIERAIRSRHRILKRILRLQLREYRRD